MPRRLTNVERLAAYKKFYDLLYEEVRQMMTEEARREAEQKTDSNNESNYGQHDESSGERE